MHIISYFNKNPHLKVVAEFKAQNNVGPDKKSLKHRSKNNIKNF
jgi:hypothetical protein